MKIQITLKGPLKKYDKDVTMQRRDWPAGTVVKDIVTAMNLPGQFISMVTVNGVKATMEDQLQEGDKIAVFPYVSGG